MTTMMQVRVVVAVVGVLVWGYGMARDEPQVRLVGIAILALSLVLRFVRKRRQPDDDASA